MSGFINNDYYIFSQFDLPKQPYTDLTLMEEMERYERMSTPVDPIMMANHFRVQTELMHKYAGTSIMNDARASLVRGKFNVRESSRSLNEKVSGLVDAAKGKADTVRDRLVDFVKEVDQANHEFAIETNEGVSKFISSLSKSSDNTSKMIDGKAKDFSVSTNELMTDIKDSIVGLDIASASAEEKERLRRTNEKIDPMVEGRKHRVEDQLIHSVKLVN